MTLPDPIVKYDKAILKGRILDYQKGMPDKGSLYYQDVIREGAQEGKIRIQDDGTFYHEMNVFMITPCTIMSPFGTIEEKLLLLSSISAKTPESNLTFAKQKSHTEKKSIMEDT